MEKYIVYTEIIDRKGVERWFYGVYDRRKANEVAMSLGTSYSDDGEKVVAHNACKVCDAEALGVFNLPASVFE